MSNTYKIGIVVDDHQLFADSFSALLEKTQIFQEVHIIPDPKDFMQYLMKNPKKEIYLFLDYYLGDVIGIEMINDIRRLNKKINVIVVTSVTNPATIQMIKSYKPEGIISKASGFDTILDSIQNVEKGKIYCCPVIDEHLKKLPADNIVFTLREIELLKLFSEGLSIVATAQKLFISKHTVVSHRRKMMAKVQCKTITELLTYARKHGIISE